MFVYYYTPSGSHGVWVGPSVRNRKKESQQPRMERPLRSHWAIFRMQRRKRAGLGFLRSQGGRNNVLGEGTSCSTFFIPEAPGASRRCLVSVLHFSRMTMWCARIFVAWRTRPELRVADVSCLKFGRVCQPVKV